MLRAVEANASAGGESLPETEIIGQMRYVALHGCDSLMLTTRSVPQYADLSSKGHNLHQCFSHPSSPRPPPGRTKQAPQGAFGSPFKRWESRTSVRRTQQSSSLRRHCQRDHATVSRFMFHKFPSYSYTSHCAGIQSSQPFHDRVCSHFLLHGPSNFLPLLPTAIVYPLFSRCPLHFPTLQRAI
jgi:hypothetical protein